MNIQSAICFSDPTFSTVGVLASISSDVSVAPVSSVASVGLLASISSDVSAALDASVAPIAKAASEAFKSKLVLFFDFVIQFYKLLKLCISLQFKKQKISSRDSKYIRWIFGYYRSKYLRRVSYPNLKVTESNFSVHNNFFTVHGGCI